MLFTHQNLGYTRVIQEKIASAQQTPKSTHSQLWQSVHAMLCRWTLQTFALFAVFIGVPSAHALTVNFERGTEYLTQGVADFATLGNQMNGMQVKATLSDGRIFTSSWGSLGVESGNDRSGVASDWGSVSGFSIGPTDQNYMRIKVNALGGITLRSLVFSGAPGGTMFDCRFNGFECEQFNAVNDPGTPGSRGAPSAGIAYANPYASNNFLSSDVFAEYANMIGLNGIAPVGDLFEQFSLFFDTPADTGLSSAYSDLYYQVDTDSIALNASLIPSNAVPEPASYALFATGLIGLLLTKRQNRVLKVAQMVSTATSNWLAWLRVSDQAHIFQKLA